MHKTLELFYDDECGIRRVPISDGSFPLRKVGDRLVICLSNGNSPSIRFYKNSVLEKFA